jgi:hypothetical protein
MSRWIRVLKVPESGYFVVGQRTIPANKGTIAEVYENELKDVDNLVRDKAVEYIAPPPPQA